MISDLFLIFIATWIFFFKWDVIVFVIPHGITSISVKATGNLAWSSSQPDQITSNTAKINLHIKVNLSLFRFTVTSLSMDSSRYLLQIENLALASKGQLIQILSGCSKDVTLPGIQTCCFTIFFLDINNYTGWYW